MTTTRRNTVAAVAIPVALFLFSLAYYYLLSAKIWTWLYVTGDSGDWMQFTNWWIVPQPMGSPLFVSVLRLLGWLFPNADTYQMLTLSLSVIPGAVLVVLTYLIGLELTKSRRLGAVAALSLMGMSITLTQATALEQYMFTAVFVAGAFLLYLKNKITWAVAMLGLGTASHAIVGVIAVLWLAVERRHYKLIPLFILLGALPYTMVLILMASNHPPLTAGNLSWGSLDLYLGNTYLTGNLSLVSIPKRLWDVAAVFVVMVGLGCYPLVVGFIKPRTVREKIALVTILALLWFWFSNTFFSTFKFVVLATPLIAGYVAYGLTRLPRWQTVVVAAGAIALIAINSVGLNTAKLAGRDPIATELYSALSGLPEGTAVLTPRGGSYGFVLFYALSEGRDLTPILLKKLVLNNDGEYEIDQGYRDYLKWFKVNYPEYQSEDSFTIAQEALDNNRAVYYISLPGDPIKEALDIEPTGVAGLYRVTKVRKSWDEWIEQRLQERLSQ